MSIRRIFRLSLATAALCLLSSLTEARADAVKWRNNVDAAKIEAVQANKLVLLHFWSPSCGPCIQLDRNVFSQPQIGQLLEQNFVPVKVNADISPALASAFSIDRVPTDVVLSPQGNVVAKLSCPPTASGYGTQLLNLNQHYRQQIANRNVAAQAPIQSAYAGLKVGQYNNPALATASGASHQAATVSQAQPGLVGNTPATVPRTGPGTAPQVTHNRYASATANPQLPTQPMKVAPAGRYQNQQVANQQVAAAVPQVAPTQPTAVHMTSSHTHLPPQQQIAVPTIAAATTAAVVPNTVSKPIVPLKLPAGSPPLAFEGYCPTTLKHAHKWVLGSIEYGAIHRGRTYLFIGEAQRQQFLANPDAYSPVFSGIDPVKLLDENKTVEGKRQFGYKYRGAFYLFASQESMTRFAARPDQYAAGVRQAMARMDGAGSGTLRR